VKFGASAIGTNSTESTNEAQGSSNGPNVAQVAGGILNLVGKALPIVGAIFGGI